MAFVSAWSHVVTYESCMNAASTIEYYPFNPLKVTQSRYAIERSTEDDQVYLDSRRNRTRLDINAQIITAPTKINVDKVRGVPSLAHLAQIPYPGEKWVDFVNRVCQKQLPNRCFFIGRLPPYISNNGTVVCFD